MNYKLPAWFKQEIPDNLTFQKLRLLCAYKVNTVCQEARCPNLPRCFKNSRFTFMILGDTCTRNCGFCAVNKSEGNHLSLDLEEPLRVARAVRELGLNYVVITSVTRDDLTDGGAGIFAQTIELIQRIDENIKVEVLIPDFGGKLSSIQCLLAAQPDVVAHNLETVERLYKDLRPQTDYRISLTLLRRIKELNPALTTKSSLILGLGETGQEVSQAMKDLRECHCDILTLGQYLAPSLKHCPVKEFITPGQFEEYKELALDLGFKAVLSAPLARSSYEAEAVYGEFAYA